MFNANERTKLLYFVFLSHTNTQHHLLCWPVKTYLIFLIQAVVHFLKPSPSGLCEGENEYRIIHSVVCCMLYPEPLCSVTFKHPGLMERGTLFLVTNNKQKLLKLLSSDTILFNSPRWFAATFNTHVLFKIINFYICFGGSKHLLCLLFQLLHTQRFEWIWNRNWCWWWSGHEADWQEAAVHRWLTTPLYLWETFTAAIQIQFW